MKISRKPILKENFFYNCYKNVCIRDVDLDGKLVLLRAHIQVN